MAVVLLVWLVLALLLSLSGALHQVPLPMPMLGGMITVVLLAVLTVGSTWRARTLELGFRPLIAIHLARFVGFYFLWLYSLGVLARNFAVPAGWGDVIVAVLAIPLLMMRDGLATRWRTLLIAWNLIGLADILVVVVLAFRMSIADPGFQNAFTSLPLSLLPLYIVPLVIASHGVMLYKLAAPGLSTSVRTRTLSMLVAVMGTSAVLHSAQAPQSQGLPSETPAQFTRTADSFDYVKRDVMIPMRDGVKLHTIVLVPRGAKGAPILLTRTPYDARVLTGHAQSAHLGPILSGYDNATDVIVSGGYIRAVQDVRGKYGSEGDYVMNRPLHGRLNPTSVDHATDTYDTIDWLVKNIPESNGRIGILGISYDGFLPLMALVNPHPALKVSVPMNPMVDGWMGDDWFHNGAFRQQNMPYVYEQEATRGNDERWWTDHFDDYDVYMRSGSAGELGRKHGLEQVGFWKKLLEHPAYDAFWREQAMDRILAAQPLKVPVMLVHSLWDQEDIYGAIAVYKALKPKDTTNDKVFLVMGPWHHGQEIEDGSTLGALKFNSDTALYFRQMILGPFLDRYLKTDEPQADIAPVTAFETGTNTWRRLPAWPAGCATGCTPQPTPLYLRAGLATSFSAPVDADSAFDEYVSDPAKPVPFRARPIQPVGYDNGLTWPQWLADDQREASGRPDVLAFSSEPLTTAVKISGQPVANLVASTSGTDSDWVVKVIDVYPDEVAGQPAMGGYQLMVSADIFRGRYRESTETPKAIAADTPLLYRFPLPTANHVFLPGHRIMVQVQSSWFPLYDRNPQSFVPNIFWAKPGDYKKAAQRIYHAPDRASFVELPIVTK